KERWTISIPSRGYWKGHGSLPNQIIGGDDASPGEWPWQVTLQLDSNHFCGGSLISDQWVLTAAQCRITVFLGRHNVSGPNPNDVSRKVEDAVCHPDYDVFTFDNDICLLKLSAPVNFTDYIYPVCLAAANSTFHSGTSSWVTGWGNEFKSASTLPDILQEVEVPVVGNNECECSYPSGITDNMICSGHRQGGKGICQGDGGGSLLIEDRNNSVWLQIGILSFTRGCALPMIPAGYTRVSRYQEWITDVTGTSQPGFVRFNSPGVDSDEGYVCPTTHLPPTTYLPPTTTDGIFMSCLFIMVFFLLISSSFQEISKWWSKET
uniref:Peptidase S1 domain-containing protein n=1 Tax=Mola mola TaxID=94237 RepID=A0A3Q3WMW3_MOLML